MRTGTEAANGGVRYFTLLKSHADGKTDFSGRKNRTDVSGEVTHPDLLAFGHQHQALDHVAQFPYVARPGILSEPREGFL